MAVGKSRFRGSSAGKLHFNNNVPNEKQNSTIRQGHNSLPPNFTVLPPLEGFINSTKDVWGNEIIYQVQGTTIKLISYGKDQKPGGVGENLDVIGIFEAKNGFGGWAGEGDNNWTVKPLANISTSKAAHNKAAGSDR